MLSHIRAELLNANLQVATPRVRTAVKADIPHVEDHVSKLHAVGAQTQQKLQDVSGACEAAGVYGVKLPHNCVSKGASCHRENTGNPQQHVQRHWHCCLPAGAKP